MPRFKSTCSSFWLGEGLLTLNIYRSTTLFGEGDDLCLWGGRNGLGFPALEKLTLDFSEWQLTDSEGLLVVEILPSSGSSRLLTSSSGEAIS